MHAGSVVVVNVKPSPQFKLRSGLATSTRACGVKLWGAKGLPDKAEDEEFAARMLFGAENPPGSAYVSGSQDALGLVLPVPCSR